MHHFHAHFELHPGFTMLQETHSCPQDEIHWKNEWNGKICFAMVHHQVQGLPF